MSVLAYAKPKIIILDDDYSLLEVIYYYFNEKFKNTVLIKVFSKSYDFIEYIQDYCYLPDRPYELINSFYNNARTKEQAVQVLKDLSELSATLVLDHELRGEIITGIELSKQIREYYPSSYISLLTSNISDSKAIELHNNHSIDLFVDKKDTNTIHDLYVYLSKHLDDLQKECILDTMDLFKTSGILDDADYVSNKRKLLEINSPLAYLTLSERGDIALMDQNNRIVFWQYNSITRNFINAE